MGMLLGPVDANAIENGTDATGNNFIVPINTEYSEKLVTTCGGALIAGAIVATAGHCVLNSDGLLSKNIWVGPPGSAAKIDSYSKWTKVAKVQITDSFKPGFDSKVGNDDVVFLVLEKSFVLKNNVRLASESEIQQMKNSQTPLKLYGYGNTTDDGAEAAFPNQMEGTFSPLNYVDPNSFGISSLLSGICKGDSGGPILSISATEIIVVGVITGGNLSKKCSKRESSGNYLTSGTLLSRYSNLAFAAAVTYINVVEAQIPLRSTITCIKGKTAKTITGISPVCPTGYKRK